MAKLKRRSHSEEFKREAVKLVADQGYSRGGGGVGHPHVETPHGGKLVIPSRKQKFAAEAEEQDLTEEERRKLAQLRAENKRLRRERDILPLEMSIQPLDMSIQRRHIFRLLRS